MGTSQCQRLPTIFSASQRSSKDDRHSNCLFWGWYQTLLDSNINRFSKKVSSECRDIKLVHFLKWMWVLSLGGITHHHEDLDKSAQPQTLTPNKSYVTSTKFTVIRWSFPSLSQTSMALKKNFGSIVERFMPLQPIHLYSYRETGNGWVTPKPQTGCGWENFRDRFFFPTFLVLILVDPLFASAGMVPTSRGRWKGRKFGASDFNKIAVLGVQENFQGFVWLSLLTEIILSKNPSIYKVYLAIVLGFRRS